MNSRRIRLSIVLLFAALSGCRPVLNTSYGPSKGSTAMRSLNGFSALRDTFTDQGFKSRELYRLTSRVRRASVIVWTPTHPSGIERRTTNWFENWFRTGGKTLVYVLPDSGSESSYYREARNLATPSQRLEYRRKYAESLIWEHQWQLDRIPLASNGWFTASPKAQISGTAKATEEAEAIWDQSETSEGNTRYEWIVEAYDVENAPTSTGGNVWKQTGPGANWPITFETTTSGTEVKFTSLLETDSGDTVLARITSDRWSDSQILVVAGGSLLTNFALTHEENRKLASAVVAASIKSSVRNQSPSGETNRLPNGPVPQVAFAQAVGQFPVSERAEDIPRATGAEMLTVYPLGLVTFHLAVLGFVICLMLMPIFGRPRKTSRGSLTHFGDHLDAVANLMRRSGGEAYARRRVSDYMKRVRGETAGRWVLPDQKPQATAPDTASANNAVTSAAMTGAAVTSAEATSVANTPTDEAPQETTSSGSADMNHSKDSTPSTEADR